MFYLFSYIPIKYLIYLQTYLQVPTKPIIDGIDAAANSVHLEINKILSAIILAVVVLSICIVKYLIKEKTNAVQAVREDYAKEQAINEGAHQNMIATKDQHIKHLTVENVALKEQYAIILKDNTEAFRGLILKIGSFVEGQAVVAANQEKNKSEILLEINRTFTSLRNIN